MTKEEREAKVAELYQQGVYIRKIAVALGCTERSINHIVRRLGLPRRGHEKRDYTPLKGKIEALGREGVSLSKIAQELQVSGNMVAKILDAAGIPRRARLYRQGVAK